MVPAHSHRARIEQKNPGFGILGIGHRAVFRDMGMTEQYTVHLFFRCVKKHLTVSGFYMGRVSVQGEKAKSAHVKDFLLRGVNSLGTQPQSRVAVPPHDVGGNIGKFPEDGVSICRTVAQKNESIRLTFVTSDGGTDVMPGTVGIGKNKNFHKFALRMGWIGKDAAFAYSENKGGLRMKLDMKTVQMLAGMPDDRLWATLHLFVSGMGMELPERKRRRIDYDALRFTLSRITPEDVARINEISDMYRQYRKGGYRR